MNQQKLPGASTVLTMGILATVGSLICCGPFAAIFSVIGLVQANKAEKLYQENPELYEDYGNIKTGRILSYIGLALSIIVLILYIAYFGFIMAVISNNGEFPTDF